VQKQSAPQPVRALGDEGSKMWARIWELGSPWISQVMDLDHITLLCESVDERQPLRATVLAGGEWRDRVALRALDVQIANLMGALGLNPSERAKLNLDSSTEDESDQLTRMRARYASGRG